MNTYRVTETEANHVSYIRAKYYWVNQEGYLIFENDCKTSGDGPEVAGTYAPGNWSYVHLLPEKTAAPINTITHPVASAEEIAEALKGATITTTAHDDQWNPVTGAAVYDPETVNRFYNHVGVTINEVRAEVGRMMRDIN